MVRIQTRALEESQIQSRIARHRAFLERAAEGSFLRSWSVFAASEPVRLPQPDGSVLTDVARLQPHHVDPTRMVDAFERWDLNSMSLIDIAQRPTLASPGLGDLMPFSQPFAKIPWLEAMLGCPIKMTEGQIWVERYEGDLEAFVDQGVDIRANPWFDRYLAFLRVLQERIGDRFPVTANTLLRGPSDLVANMMGVKEACMAWIDTPDRMAHLMRVCTDLVLAVIEAGSDALKPWAGGAMSGFGIWTPGAVIRAQDDHSSLLSPERFERQLLPFDREVIRAAPHCIFHIHNNGLHTAPLLTEIPELDAIEVMMDPYPTGKRKTYEVTMLRRIQEEKPLLLDVNAPSLAEAEWLLAQLSKRGLCFNARFAPEIYRAERSVIPESPLWTFARP